MATVREIASPGLSSALPDWNDAAGYGVLGSADRTAFAWEWLRRTDSYRDAWESRDTGRSDASAFGLERFEDPRRETPMARPIWSASIDQTVIRAKVHSLHAAASDRIDLLDLQHLVTLTVSEDQIEHLLLSDGFHSLRIDIVQGTLIGCPAVLRYLIEGIDTLRGPLATIDRLVRLSKTGRLDRSVLRPTMLTQRWISELRVADALASGADYQEIARALYGDHVSANRWRTRSTPFRTRTRTQRQVRTARRRLDRPLDPAWFAPD